MTEPRVTDLIPHRGPMLLVDEIVELLPDQATCRKTFRSDEYFFQGHYPDHPLVPGVILCECAAQTAAILLARHHVRAAGNAEHVPVLTRLNNVRFRQTVHPGDTIEIHAKLDDNVSSAWFLSATIRKDGGRVARLELACTLAPHPSAAAPEQQR
jgi:3-hydroxyacyl-[acyl-carrier-protein] dehydratase